MYFHLRGWLRIALILKAMVAVHTAALHHLGHYDLLIFVERLLSVSLNSCCNGPRGTEVESLLRRHLREADLAFGIIDIAIHLIKFLEPTALLHGLLSCFAHGMPV